MKFEEISGRKGIGKRMNDWKKLSAYEMEDEKQLQDIKGEGTVLRHKKSGARVCLVSNKDDNKVFYIGFRTPPVNSTGVAHIIEHTVLCGSTKFPAKDPFIELAKGSLNTFLNAMTYPDKTVYPLASCNEKDFQNLMDVYLDAVFHPNIYKRKEIFQQEGWHYELESADSDLLLNGIVYSEMKGVFSSPEQQLTRKVQASLFPDTSYGVESGGDPDYIPDLSYEEFLDFHRRYYHPSNSYIYLYGDMDMEEKLIWLDKEYLQNYDVLSIDSEIKKQEDFKEMREKKIYYSLSENEEEEENTYLSYNVSGGTSLDVERCIALQILESVLLSAPGAPLKQALIEAGIGRDILSSIDTDIFQPVFSIIAKNASFEQKDAFHQLIKEQLSKLINQGFLEKSLRAAISTFEFRYRESDYGQYPKGLMFGLQLMSSWLYDDKKAFLYADLLPVYESLKDKIGTGYYESLASEFLLNAGRATSVTLAPKKGLNAQKEEQLKNKLSQYKSSLSEKDIEELVNETKRLAEYQEEPSSQQDIEKIPMLNREDIQKQTQDLYNEERGTNSTFILHHKVDTNGIGYIKFLFDLDFVPSDLVPYLGLLTSVLGYIDTEHYSFLELSNEIQLHTGSMSFDLVSFGQKNNPDYFRPMFCISTKILYSEVDEVFGLLHEIIHSTKFTDTKRIQEILQEMKSRLQMRMNSKGHTVTMDRAMSYFNQGSYFDEITRGIEFYHFIENLLNEFEEKKAQISSNLEKLAKLIFSKGNLFISMTSEEEGYQRLSNVVENFSQALFDTTEDNQNAGKFQKFKGADFHFPMEKKNEGFEYTGQVQYVARCGNFMKAGFQSSGVLKVLKSILSYEYLWNNIRVKGGAYGCFCGFSGMDGTSYFLSYRDPNLRETNLIYEGVCKYIKEFAAQEREMTKYIIGTISGVDTPLTPMMKGSRSLNAYMCGVEKTDLQKDRDEILQATEQDIRNTEALVQAVLDENALCAIGNDVKIRNNASMFQQIKPLFK